MPKIGTERKLNVFSLWPECSPRYLRAFRAALKVFIVWTRIPRFAADHSFVSKDSPSSYGADGEFRLWSHLSQLSCARGRGK